MAPRSISGEVGKLFGRARDYGALYQLFREAGDNAQSATGLLSDLMEQWPEGADRRHQLRDLEHEGDRITHDILNHLNRKANSPFDREDGFALATRLDDVVDYTEEVGDFLALYQVEAPMEQAIALTRVLRGAGREIAAAFGTLEELPTVRPHLAEINRLEKEGDRLTREGLAALFSGGIDPLVIIRWKDLYERVEAAIDASQQVAHVIEGILVKRQR